MAYASSPPKPDRRGMFLEFGMWVLFVLLLVPAGVVGWAIGHRDAKAEAVTVTVAGAGSTKVPASASAIQAAPAFDSAQLAAAPTDDWVTNGGSLGNQRYSPLTQIDDSNVKQLKGVWLTHLRKSAVAAKYSAESQPLVYNGVIYVPTGEDDVFAVRADTGKILWQYKAHLDQTISTVCCGWESRGVALGDGRVFLGLLDGTVAALDQKTGEEVWRVRVEHWQRGYTITGAPLYYNGMVITGVSGGEFLARGRV